MSHYVSFLFDARDPRRVNALTSAANLDAAKAGAQTLHMAFGLEAGWGEFTGWKGPQYREPIIDIHGRTKP